MKSIRSSMRILQCYQKINYTSSQGMEKMEPNHVYLLEWPQWAKLDLVIHFDACGSNSSESQNFSEGASLMLHLLPTPT